jgi:Phage P22-like portal protein
MFKNIAAEHSDKLESIKTKIEQSYRYFDENYRRYHKFMKFVYDSSLSADDVSKLIVLKKPNIEFNILEAFINQRIGEFSKHEPSLQVRAADGLTASQINEQLTKTIEVVEGHIREIIDSTSNDGLQTNLYKDTMGGGFSVAEVYTDYISDLSFEQCIKVERAFDPTLCGFDPLARSSHKGDGQYCFKIIPRTKEDFEAEYGAGATDGLTFQKNVDFGSFNWSYMNEQQSKYNKILLEVWFWQKERKKETIVKLSNGSVIVKRHYEQLLDYWNNVLMKMEQPPIIIEERRSEIESIHFYKLVENRLIEHKLTNWKYLPLVFIDGNSATIKRSNEDASYQMTRPYVYAAEGIQRLKNFAGQSIASELETLVQHKFMVSIESIPEDYVDAYTNPQQAQVLAYNAFYEKNPNMPLPPPQVIQRTDTPSIVQATFEGTDRTTQAILGSFDAQQGIVGDQISGRAIERGAMQSDAASRPYLENFIKGMNRIGQILLDLIPKYYLTPRTIPIKKANGMRSYQPINDSSNPESIELNYDSNALQIKIEAGVNSSMQKQYALDQITKLMDASELFAKFINSDGLEILLENIDIKGIENLKERAAKFMQNMKEQPPQPDPLQQAVEVEREKNQGQLMNEAEKIKQKREEAQAKQAMQGAEMAIKEQEAHIMFLKVLNELEEKHRRLALEENAHDSQLSKDAIQLAVDITAQHHDMSMREKEHEASMEQQSQAQQPTEG